MGERIYRASNFVFIKEIVSMLFGFVFLAFLLMYFLDNLVLSIGIALVVLLPALFFTGRDKKLYVKVTDEMVTIVKGRKSSQYRLGECALKASSENRESFTLYITDADGKKADYDLSLLGYTRWQELLADLKITGDHAESVVLDAHS